MEIKIHNKRKMDEIPADFEYVGRPSPLGNPFTAKQEGSRELAVKKYQTWLNLQWKTGNKAVEQELNRLATKLETNGILNLVCWCYPLKCHAEVIAKALEIIIKWRKSEQ